MLPMHFSAIARSRLTNLARLLMFFGMFGSIFLPPSSSSCARDARCSRGCGILP